MWVIGLMSGTSADAIDVALVEWPEGRDARPFKLIAFREFPHSSKPPVLVNRYGSFEVARSIASIQARACDARHEPGR